ncbi:DUF858 domain protein [Cordyceps militaris CM01]|uniref:Alpha N-terminal protein methyltransferase 1 n=1 Tax=Cordyceps militaris (strain CM01) TaxID=983644 RepID=G3JM18_CORMM|nr:DUF858 domain protein [Cordyceps militaris CM01]EGX90742.1 DUF858 domain protein [Cordyceps militaris CM01]
MWFVVASKSGYPVMKKKTVETTKNPPITHASIVWILMDMQSAGEEPTSQPDRPSGLDGLIDAQAGRKYWENAEATDDGMLGGIPTFKAYSHISRMDIQASRAFLARLGIGLKANRALVKSAVDAGAGITTNLLLHVADEVDVVEPVARFTEPLKGTKGVRQIYNVGLEEWQPIQGTKYDIIWTQWCLGYLTDAQILKYLEVCKTVLTPESGLLIVKENVSSGLEDLFDAADNSVTRPKQSSKERVEYLDNCRQKTFPTNVSKRHLNYHTVPSHSTTSIFVEEILTLVRAANTDHRLSASPTYLL